MLRILRLRRGECESLRVPQSLLVREVVANRVRGGLLGGQDYCQIIRSNHGDVLRTRHDGVVAERQGSIEKRAENCGTTSRLDRAILRQCSGPEHRADSCALK
jgi:hypothetical protein